MQAFIREEIAGFAPKPADLDYPDLLLRVAQQAQQAATATDEAAAASAAEAEGRAAGGGTSEALPVSTTNGDAAAAPPEPMQQLYAGWYPPVQRCLLLLGKLYRGLDQRIFNGLAHEAVLAATAAVQGAARQILKVGALPLCVRVCAWGYMPHTARCMWAEPGWVWRCRPRSSASPV